MNFNFQMTSYRITNGGSRGSYSLYLWNYLKADLKTELFSFLFSSFYLVLPGLLFQGRFSTDPPTALAFSSFFFFFSVVLLRCPHTHTHTSGLGPSSTLEQPRPARRCWLFLSLSIFSFCCRCYRDAVRRTGSQRKTQ